jgi:hypothetical protein
VSTRRSSLWLRCYPPSWRERYGEELEGLVEQMNGKGSVAWRVRRDVALTGARERLRSWGLAGPGIPPGTQAKAGALLVLCAWTLFVVAGMAVQRFSEHWQDFTPISGRALPSGEFRVLVDAALIGGALVLLGGACVLPRLLAFLRGGGWSATRGSVLRAVFSSLFTAVATVGLIQWAHRLDSLQRNGHDPLYGIAFIAWGLLVVGCLGMWTSVVVEIARRIEFPVGLLKVEVGLAVAVSLAMLTMTVATATWWITLAIRAPWALREEPSGAVPSPFLLQLMAAMALMVLATALAGLGSARALRALPRMACEQRVG